MAGYLDGATASERPLHDLVQTLPGMFPADASVSFKTFGAQIRSIPAAKQRDILSPAYFSCRGRPKSDCDNSESRLDLVAREIEANRQGLAVLITDMWFSDPASTTSGLVPLAGPLQAILADGRAIGVFGIPAPFDGTIYDLPGGRQERFVGRRPLMLLVIGPKDRVTRFGEDLGRSPSAFLENGIKSGAIRQALFSIDPSSPSARSDEPLTSGTDQRVRPASVLEAMEGVRVQQFRINRSDARRDTAGADAPQWIGPKDTAFLKNAAWKGPYATRTRVWLRRGETCTKEDWIAQSAFEGGWQAGSSDGQVKFELSPANFVSEFRRPGVYLVTGEVARTSLTQPNPASQWLRDWSFGPQQESGRATERGEAFYRTLNLADFGRLLENALADAAEQNPGPITGFTFAVEVVD